MADTMVVTKNWLEKIKKRTNQQQYNEICAKILDYGIFEEYEESEDNLVNSHLDWLLPQIDLMRDKYEHMIEQGKKGGRPSTLDNKQIWKMYNVDGMKGVEIAKKLGIPPSTLYSTESWKKRNDKDYIL